MFWPLMKDCITQKDKDELVNFIKTSNRYTNGPQVKEFEKQWSQWLGVEHSLFVSSGSTANTLLLSAIVEKYNLKRGDKVLVPAMTWVTNVAPVIQLGLEPIFCDVEPKTFSFDLEHLQKLSEEHSDIAADTLDGHRLWLGQWYNNQHRLTGGNIGPVQIYNRALSAAEVLQNYNAQKERFGL